MTANPLLAAALRLAAAGWPVFPCKPGSKAPDTPNGFKNATTSEPIIRAWWDRQPLCNVAIATGAPAVDVLDIDVKTEVDGMVAFHRLRRTGLLAGALALVRTPSGGLHVYFAGSDQRCGALREHGLDFKARGGYVLAPPSIVAGTAYTLLEHRSSGRRLDWPTVRRLLDPPRMAPTRPPGCQGNGIQGLVRWMAQRPPGERNVMLNWAAYRACQAGCSEDELAEIEAAAVAAGLPVLEARRTIQSARNAVTGVRR